uniref:HGH1 homolog n=1 Tax=Calidris pygmaea TaxID=425635 RepID=A0A8C3JYJ2_9CHAR
MVGRRRPCPPPATGTRTRRRRRARGGGAPPRCGRGRVAPGGSSLPSSPPVPPPLAASPQLIGSAPPAPRSLAPGCQVTPAILAAAVMAAEEAVEAAMAELAALLAPGAGEAARAGAAEAALALSGSPAGRRLLAGRPEALSALLELAAGPGPPAACSAQACLVNVSAEAAARRPLLGSLPALLGLLPGGPACGVLANLCRERGAARRVLRALRERGCGLGPLLQALGEPQPPPQLGPLLCNLSQLPEGRRGLLDRSRYGSGVMTGGVWGCPPVPVCPPPSRCDRPSSRRRSVQRLLPFTQYKDSTVHRRGIVGALRNCCFEYEDHEWLLSEEVDILPFLLLPLAGPEEFPEDEMERLPVDLQYLPPDKQREEEPDIRKMLLEAIMLVGPSGGNGSGAEPGGACIRGVLEGGESSRRSCEGWTSIGDTSHHTRLLQARSNLPLNPSRDGAATASLGNLGQALTTLRGGRISSPYFT